MKFINPFAALFLLSGVSKAQNLRRSLGRVDPSACDDESAFSLPAGFVCDFPIVIAGFGVSGLPEGAAAAMEKQGLSVGINPPAGFYRVEDDTADNPCESIVSSYVGKGKGANFEAPEDSFRWSGSFVLARPSGQTSYVDKFPDQQGGLWEVSGSVFFEDGGDFTLVKYNGKKPFDICAYLAEN